MQLSPLQSRLAASFIASCLLLIIYLLLFPPQFAFAAEFDPIAIHHDSRFRALAAQDLEMSEATDLRAPVYEPEFGLFDRSIIGRAPDNVITLTNNKLERSNLAPGATMAYVYSASSVARRAAQDEDEHTGSLASLNESRGPTVDADLYEDGDEDGSILGPELTRRQQPSRTLWISANTCEQPTYISPNRTNVDPPQLTLYVSTSTDNTSPGPSQTTGSQRAIPFKQGAVMFNVSLSQDVYFSVSAPEVSAELFDASKQYNFEIVASTDRYYFSYDDQSVSELVWVDSDWSAALFKTDDLPIGSDQADEMPYVMFAHDRANPALNGLRNSYCGLSLHAQIRGLADGTSGVITMGLKKGREDNATQQEFYISSLDASSTYIGILARPPGKGLQTRQNSSASDIGGGRVFRPTEFETKPFGACTFVFNLTVCDETEYAVPGNLNNFPNGTALAAFYDDYTRTMWDNFDKVLQQVPCEAPVTSKYSLARGCDDCKAAYKNWLCSVAVPRCEDFSSPDRPALQMRNIGQPFPNGTVVDPSVTEAFGHLRAFNTSRNPQIDEVVQPGPYKELLPCEDLCYELVRSCPASLGFACPRPFSEFGFNTSYGRRNITGGLTCNYPGSAHFPPSAAPTTAAASALAALVSVLVLLLGAM
ncbi:stretch-activated Ca2+-permeable channel component-domain-containing protein [Durotheca rogersii]|uniref:stretch-activated Ca2+-permeable channel component-domain-containing protein n=1 Tax=Durotheca rogersii TaxID=419775 RepID=UPI00221F6C64|nr:stretch-activated Ca2+-permeable channel component-domain-containing protein [Durotheca rogersii]KAI5862801.1 stretch-activated Ca2+-permeable channel component-domain-containing protein [Durotheca rogersii]